MTAQGTGNGLEVRRPAPAVGPRGVLITDLDGLARLAACVHKSRLAPKGFDSPEAIAVAMQLGMELGFTPLAALQNVAVINGRPGVYGDAALALVEDSGLLEDFAEHFEHRGKAVESFPADAEDGTAAVCVAKRHTRSRATRVRFSVADAKLAGLWGKQGPWTQYPGRMLRFRARGFCLRDAFADVLKGLKTAEELQDYPAPRGAPAGGWREHPGRPGTVIEVTPVADEDASQEPASDPAEGPKAEAEAAVLREGLAATVKKALRALAERGVPEARVLATLAVRRRDDVSVDHLVLLREKYAALVAGEHPDQHFPPEGGDDPEGEAEREAIRGAGGG